MVSTSLNEYGLDPNDMALLSESRPRNSPDAKPRMLSEGELTSTDHVALQFYWQGLQVFAHSHIGEEVVPCFYASDCECTAEDNAREEFVRILPANKLQGRAIVDATQVQILSVSSGRYLRASRLSKFLRWSDNHDEPTVFQIESVYRSSSLSAQVQFRLESVARPGHFVGVTETRPLGYEANTGTAMGFLTLEKKRVQHEGSLIFPLRFRAVHRSQRFEPSFESPAHTPVACATPNSMGTVEETDEDTSADLPMALLLSLRHESHIQSATVVKCPYCHQHLRSQTAMVDHVRTSHREWLQRESKQGSYCTCCGRRKIDGCCPRCATSE